MELTFYFSGLVAVLATLRVITHSQPVYALLYLIISLLAIGIVFFSLGAYFAGAIEIIVYSGAIMVLFVFVVMMLNMDVGNSQSSRLTCLQPAVWLGPSLLSTGLLAVLVYAIWGVGVNDISGQLIEAKTVGIALFGPYVLAVELVSMLLLGAVVVAFHLGRNEYDSTGEFYKKLKSTGAIKKQSKEHA